MSNICPNCGGSIEIRNPTGKCDHLYYPENITPISYYDAERDHIDNLIHSTSINPEIIQHIFMLRYRLQRTERKLSCFLFPSEQ